ncbi:peptidase [Streptomyces viridochromogenes]|uniref:Peptidase n=1 Tax=Streptomyces viridochromogenes TaxID=1938 RepID=A0A0J7ZJG0_STRVR|nr:LysM peptidoglycan-binding domain-containing M23 family metallopeptidase [Streptomyces viridochromogenes]KMS76156.1 peptidase [Streptomyces viridochromogenes]KOG24984.1 peptidase [Streptomyces viridochromogenes]KOG26451.1 peptidase [Streptomyces viridochromogenes]
MPAKGKHRRPKSLRFTRSIAVAGTGGAALALPLIGATGAHAAPSQSVSEKAVQSLPAAEKKAVEKKDAEQKTGLRTYSVKVGDYLSKIADDQNVSGGWKQLYADNREAVGDDPSLIHPGLKLSIGGKKATTSTPKSSSSPSSSSSAPSKSSSDSTASKSSASKTTTTTKSAENAGTSSGFSAPVEGAAVATAYKVAGSMWSSGYHTGVDFAAATGTPLKAVGAGTVVSAGWGGAYGNQVVIQLADGYYAQYAHLSSLSVSSGQTVTAGQQIGLSGATGNVTGPHLHFEIRTTPDYGSDLDPVAYLRSKGVGIG